MSDKIGKRFYYLVDANSVESDSYIIPNGKRLTITNAGGNASISPDTVVLICFDYGGESEYIVLSTHGDAMHQFACETCEFIGDGSKSITIRLSNDQSCEDYMGGFWAGVLN